MSAPPATSQVHLISSPYRKYGADGMGIGGILAVPERVLRRTQVAVLCACRSVVLLDGFAVAIAALTCLAIE